MADLDDDTKNLKDQFINYRENIDKLETDFRALIKSQRDLNEVKKNQIIQKNREHIGRISQSTHKFHLSEFEKKEKN
jgi:hypothetical protein